MLKDGKEVKLTLDQTWEECLKMWKWIVERIEKGSLRSVWSLKLRWLQENGWRDVMEDCFFCEYAMTQTEQCEPRYDCDFCPGCLVYEGFHCCNDEYHYHDNQEMFLEELLKLDTMRRGTTR